MLIMCSKFAQLFSIDYGSLIFGTIHQYIYKLHMCLKESFEPAAKYLFTLTEGTFNLIITNSDLGYSLPMKKHSNVSSKQP